MATTGAPKEFDGLEMIEGVSQILMLAGAKKKRVPLKVPKPGPAFAHCGGSSLGWGGSALDEAGLGTAPLTPDIESTPVFRVGPVPPFFGVENFLVSPPFSGVGFAPVFRVGISKCGPASQMAPRNRRLAFLCAGYGRYCVCLLDGFDAPPFVGRVGAADCHAHEQRSAGTDWVRGVRRFHQIHAW